jgi:uncharacterized repeat protein (TIGR01451 family)
MNLRSTFNRLTKKTKFLIGAVTALTLLAIPAAVMAGYGPNGSDRVIYDFSNPAQREGAFDAPRFNSYVNTNVYGDERAFVDAKECVVSGAACLQNGQAGGFTDQTAVTPGKEYIIRAYVHNIANPSINDDLTTAAPNDGIGVAKNTRIRFELPTGDDVANGFTAQARISADNALPQEVYDTVDLLNSDKKFGVEFVPGSAYIFNAAHPDGYNLGDEITSTSGALIGDNAMDGVYSGCFEFSSFVVIRVRTTTPDLEIEKFASTVEVPKMSDTAESVTVKRGEKVSWRINYKNSGTHFADDVTIRDQLPKGLDIVPGSILLTTAAGNETLSDTALGSGGVNVGDYTPEGNGVIRFTTVVNTDPEVCQLTNIAFARSTNVSEKSDSARVVIEDCVVEDPKYSCNLLTAELVTDRTYRFTTVVTAENGATDTSYTYNFDDGTDPVATVSSSVEYMYNTPGTYNPSVQVTFSVNGQDVIVGGDNCTATVTIEEEEENPVYTCDSLTVTFVKGRTYKFTTATTAKNGATVKDYSYNFGDDTAVMLTDKNEVQHTYAKDGTYATSVNVTYSVNGEMKTVLNENCVKVLTFNDEVPKCTVPGKGHLPKDSPDCRTEVKAAKTVLPNTGAGSIAGAFAAVTAAGTVGHSLISRRRK